MVSTQKQKYENRKFKFLSDTSIDPYNLNLFKEFLEWQEQKLKLTNGFNKLDESNYRTLYDYIGKLKNVNTWFNNTPWKLLTPKDISLVYKNLIDGVILNSKGKPFEDVASYVNKIFKYKPFKMAGLQDIVEEVFEISVSSKEKEVKFVNAETFNNMLDFALKPSHKALLWLAWDVGENISSLLKLRWKDVKRVFNNDLNEAEYLVWLPNNIIKRSRRQRSEPTIFSQTTKALDNLKKYGREVQVRDAAGKFSKTKRKIVPFDDNDLIFGFGPRQASKILNRIVEKTGAKCEPNGEKPTWKDLRSGMACNLLNNLGWSPVDVNLRLGHSPMSRILDVYVNYFAIDRKRAKAKHNERSLKGVEEKLDKAQYTIKNLIRKQNASDEKIALMEKKFLSFLSQLEQDEKTSKAT